MECDKVKLPILRLRGQLGQIPICTLSLLLGGNCRVGLEDNLWLEKDRMAQSNATNMVRVTKELGIVSAISDEACRILGLGIANVNY